MTAPTRRYIFDPCNTDGDDGLFPQIYSVDPGSARALTLAEAKKRMAEHVAGWVGHWRAVSDGRPTDPGMPVVAAEDVPEEIEHWESVGLHWARITEQDIEPRP